MAFKFVVLASLLAIANAGLTYAPGPTISTGYSSLGYGPAYAAQAPAITSQSANILRSYGNLGQVSTYHKTENTPFSSVSKSDVRISNPGLRIASPALAYAQGPVAYSAPISHGPLAYSAPISHGPVTYSTGLHAAGPVAVGHLPAAIGVAYSAAPAVSHVTYTGLGAHYVF